MDYKSPLILLKALDINVDEIDSQNLKQFQKRLLLEFELISTEFLVIENHKISKDEIFKLFDDLEKDDHLKYHRLIYENNTLVNFLHYGTLKSNEPFDLSPSIVIEGFRSFLSPYLAYRINRSLKSQFLKRDFSTCLILSDLTVYLDPIHQSKAYDLFAGALNELINEITLVYNSEQLFNKKKYAFLLNESMIKFLNYLPEEFDHKRNHLASRLNDLGTVINEKYLDFATQLYEVLQYIRCRPELDQIISHNLNYMQRLKSKELAYTVLSVVGFAVILFFAFKFVDIVYLTSDKEKFNRKQSEYLLDHLVFTDQIIQETSKVDLQKIDSVWLDSVPNYPYFAFYSSLIRSDKQNSIKINIANESAYDLLVFNLKKQGKYCFSMPARSNKSAYISNNDLLNFYPGNNWYSRYKVTGTERNDFKHGLRSINNGLFANSSEITHAQLYKYYKVNGINVSVFDISKFRNDSLYDQQKYYDSILNYNASLYMDKPDSLVIDSINVVISNAEIDSLVIMTPYFHYIK